MSRVTAYIIVMPCIILSGTQNKLFKDAGITSTEQTRNAYLNAGDIYSIARKIVDYSDYYF